MMQGAVYRQIKQLEHPNLVKIYEVGDTISGCIVLEEYISGRTIQEELEKKGKLCEEKALEYFMQILDVLEIIHNDNMIHRDIKPENILISTDEVIKLLDFGIARFQKENQPQDTVILGTVGYASPEQFGFRQTDVRADIYALGVLLYKMLTGEMPDGEGKSRREIDGWLEKIIKKCMQLDPENRYATVGQLKKALLDSRKVKEPIERQKKSQSDNSVLPGFRSGVKWKK